MDLATLRIENPKIVEIESVDSTNSFLQRLAHLANEPVVAIAGEQTAGRGQRNASWHSLPGDATFSLMLFPKELPANRIFLLSELLALALRRTLARLGVAAEVKWPNDILVHRKKVCGVLIESSLKDGYVRRAILGVGMNLAPRPDGFAPYPTPAASLADCISVADLPSPTNFVGLLLDAWNANLALAQEIPVAAVQRSYLASLFNGKGFHNFADSEGAFRAEVVGVNPVGELLLRRADGALRAYPFKSVRQELL